MRQMNWTSHFVLCRQNNCFTIFLSCMGTLNLDLCKHSLIGKDICRGTVKKRSFSPLTQIPFKNSDKSEEGFTFQRGKSTPNMAGGECTPFTQPPATLIQTDGQSGGGEWVQLTQLHSPSVGWAQFRHPFKMCLCFALAFWGQSNKVRTVQDRASRFTVSRPFHRNMNVLLCILKCK